MNKIQPNSSRLIRFAPLRPFHLQSQVFQLPRPSSLHGNVERSCAANQNVARQHNQGPLETLKHNNLPCQDAHSAAAARTRWQRASRQRRSSGEIPDQQALCSPELYSECAINSHTSGAGAKVIRDFVWDAANHSVFSGKAALCECSSSQRLNKG